MAVLVNQVMANTAAMAAPMPRPGGPVRLSEARAASGSSVAAVADVVAPVSASVTTGCGAGASSTRSRGSRLCSGSPSTMCKPAHTKQAPRQPRASIHQAVRGQPTVLANPAMRVMPVMALRALSG